MDRDILSWGLPLGRIAGIRVRIHWILLVVWLFNLNRALHFASGADELLFWLIGTGGVFGVILLH